MFKWTIINTEFPFLFANISYVAKKQKENQEEVNYNLKINKRVANIQTVFYYLMLTFLFPNLHILVFVHILSMFINRFLKLS